MDPVAKASEEATPDKLERRQRKDWNIALLSALAASLCLGLPAGLVFWLVFLQSTAPSIPVKDLLMVFQDDPAPPIIATMLGALVWGVLLARISGYRRWRWLSVATITGVFVGQMPLQNGWLDVQLQHLLPSLPVYLRFGLVLVTVVLSTTVSTGLALGVALLNWRASLSLAAWTGLASVMASTVGFVALDRLGLRVGSGDMAMPKVTALSTLTASLAGGAMLGVVFTRYVKARLTLPKPNG